MSLVDKIFNLNKAVEDAEFKNDQDIGFLPEGQHKDNLKYLCGMFMELRQVMARYNDIIVSLDDSIPSEQVEQIRDNLIYVNDDIRLPFGRRG